MPEKLIYLDNAATAWPKPESVYSYMLEFYRNYGVNPGRSGYDLAIEAGNALEQLRTKLNRFFGGDETADERVCFGYNATDALNLIIQGTLSAGDHVVSTNLEHNSVIRPINHLVRDGGVQVTYLPFDSQGFIDPDDVKKAIRPNTKLVIVNHGSNVIGTIQPIAEIGAICRERNISFAVDTSQTAGAIPINMKAMNIDMLAFTGHKALLGCTGIGGLCLRKHVELRHTRSGGTGVKSAYPYQLEEYPYRMEFGTPNLVGIAALTAGQRWIEEQGMSNIYAHELKLTRQLVEGFRKIEGVRLYCADNLDNHLSTVSMNVEGMDAGNVGIMLDGEFNIAVRTGLHCAPLVHEQLGTIDKHGSVRFSIGPFNTVEQIESAIEAVSEIAARARSNKVGAKTKGSSPC